MQISLNVDAQVVETQRKKQRSINKSGDDDGSRAVFDDVDCFRSQG